jgi:protein-histidine pros-kinase
MRTLEINRGGTKREFYEEARLNKNLELADNRANDRFMAAMSRELRTPLNAIIEFTGLLLKKMPGPLTQAQERQLRTIHRSGTQLFSLIHDLLELAKLDSTQVDITLSPVDCNRVVEEVARRLRPLAEVKGLTFEFLCPGQTIMAMIDRRALNQILSHLVSNAIQFTERGGAQVELRQRYIDGALSAEISVQDTGIGIPLEDQAKLFEAHPRFYGSMAKGLEMGIGLYLNQMLAELMGCHITVQSEYGRGSCFTLAMPCRNQIG